MKWKINNLELDQNNLVNDIYRSRGVNDYQKLFALNEKDLYDPYLFRDMQKSVDRIMKAIEQKERILIYGDYDVDGITSTYVIYKTLIELGGDVHYDIPNRFIDGYGLSISKAYEIINDEFTLVITVDNGIKSVQEAQIFKENNVDFIITDHHKIDEDVPNSFSILHTSLSDYPFKPLAGVGVAFKLVQALIGEDSLEYVDIVSLGTIADMMPLIDENRAFVNLGLKKMKESQNIGLVKLLEFLDISEPSVADVQYKIAPRINACGRMKSAKLAVELLLSNSNQGALDRIKDIEELNNRRKKLTTMLYDVALSQVDISQPSLIIHSPKMHEGVLGIVASRLASEYSKVSVVLKEEEYTFKGSIRSYNGVDVIYILSELKDLLIRHGGHKNAAGLELKKENLPEFKRRFNDLIPDAKRDEAVTAEGKIDIETIDMDQISQLGKFDLKDCLFVFENISPENRYLIRGEHTKLIISNGIEAIFFNNKTLYNQISKIHNVTLLGRLDINTFKGRSKKQILIEDYILD